MRMILRRVVAVVVAGCVMAGGAHPGRADAAQPAAAAASGVDLQYVDPAVRAQDDTYRYLNGKWLDSFEIPADKGAYGAFTVVDDATQAQLKHIVDGLGERAQSDVDARKLADLYASFMDEPRLERAGLAPLAPTFAAIAALKDARGIAALVARANRSGFGAPYDIGIRPDPKDSTRYAVSVQQSGLGMPDRDYYLSDDAKLAAVRAKYRQHVEKMLSMAGDRDAKREAEDILALETALARLQWTRVENRDPIKTYNKKSLAELGTLVPGYDWRRYLADEGIAGKVDYLIVRQPSYLEGLAGLIGKTPVAVWREYFRWHALSSAAPYLAKRFVDERFAFTGTTLRGIPENLPRWKRGLALLNGAMGEALGRLYVAEYFPPEHKRRMQALVANLIATYREDIDHLDWMGPQTRVGAQAKLAKLAIKIAYPDTWRDYGALRITRDDLWGNVQRANEFEFRRQTAKLGKPIDRGEWFMSPQTVDAYYNPVMNEIVFPAAILQPPFFDANADDAVNYGGIGAVIGHEISHGFDDSGSQYDADGNLHDWFTAEDHARFKARTEALVAQYDAYESVPGFHVNGRLTLGENIGDNSGLAVAYAAYHRSLAGQAAPVIDGLTGDQRFYLGWVQVWRGKVREALAIELVKTDPHSPPLVRGTAPLKNQPGFYSAFGVNSGDHMYLPPEQRVSIW